ncbi:hypothetical protein FO519_009685 [Halicephalobus sp. NKZ332]|nr:hypothetical protein FO519_009685 [Halicephalobus sp. NKZ332]
MSFEEAADKVKKLKTSPNNDELLELYALYKQGTVGDNNTAKPQMVDVKGKAKWSAWDGKNGTPKEEAKELYIAKVDELVEKYGIW